LPQDTAGLLALPSGAVGARVPEAACECRMCIDCAWASVVEVEPKCPTHRIKIGAVAAVNGGGRIGRFLTSEVAQRQRSQRAQAEWANMWQCEKEPVEADVRRVIETQARAPKAQRTERRATTGMMKTARSRVESAQVAADGNKWYADHCRGRVVRNEVGKHLQMLGACLGRANARIEADGYMLGLLAVAGVFGSGVRPPTAGAANEVIRNRLCSDHVVLAAFKAAKSPL
jgi:hypothetical protein